MSRGLTLTRPFCAQCVKLQDEVLRLRAENKSLKDKLRYQQRQIDEGYFGASTPSSKKPFKPASATRNNGGARKGHHGFGRASLAPHETEEVIALEPTHECPDCRVRLDSLDVQTRTVTEVVPARVKHVVYQLIPLCGIVRVAGACMPPKPRACCPSANSATARWRILRPNIICIKSHESVWRNDGRNGYAWLFCAPTISIFRLRLTRAASVAQEVFGDEALPREAGCAIVMRFIARCAASCNIAMRTCCGWCKSAAKNFRTRARCKTSPLRPRRCWRKRSSSGRCRFRMRFLRARRAAQKRDRTCHA
jgi:hypothetical protein